MSAAERIESNNDLLTEILLRLPPKSIFRFISVSKRWNHIINDPFFLRSYSKLRRSSGDGRLLALFQTKSMVISTIPENPIHQCNTRIKKLGDFMNSSNGLILCRLRRVRYDGYEVVPTKYNVLNPVTKKYVTLPPPPKKTRHVEEYFSSFDGLMCEENTTALAPNCIVVRVCEFIDNVMRIETYCSKTGEWAPSTLAATGHINAPLRMAPVVVNGVFHWFTVSCKLAVYDPNKYKNHLQLIKLPCPNYVNSSYVTVTRSPSPDDILWYGLAMLTKLKFWKLEKKGQDGGTYKRGTTIGRDEWILMHEIRLTSLYRGVEIIRSKEECPSFVFAFHDEVDRGLVGFVSRDPLVALLKWGDTLFLYNFETKTNELVHYHGRLLSGDEYSGTLRPYFESSSLSSYAL